MNNVQLRIALNELIAGGHLSMKGILSTQGSWTRMWTGCGQYTSTGQEMYFKSGGDSKHRGEFIHSHCSDYRVDAENSITSLW